MRNDQCPHCSAEVGQYDQTCAACGKGLSGSALLAENQQAGANSVPVQAKTAAGTIMLVILSLGAGAIGMLGATVATSGVALICAGCLLAVLARIMQAGAQHRETLQAIQRPR